MSARDDLMVACAVEAGIVDTACLALVDPRDYANIEDDVAAARKAVNGLRRRRPELFPKWDTVELPEPARTKPRKPRSNAPFKPSKGAIEEYINVATTLESLMLRSRRHAMSIDIRYFDFLFRGGIFEENKSLPAIGADAHYKALGEYTFAQLTELLRAMELTLRTRDYEGYFTLTTPIVESSIVDGEGDPIEELREWAAQRDDGETLSQIADLLEQITRDSSRPLELPEPTKTRPRTKRKNRAVTTKRAESEV